MGDTLATKVLQLHPFQVIPDPFRRVQLWGIPRRLLQVNPVSSAVTQVLFHYPAAVDGSPIPEHQQLSSNVPCQVLEETHHVGSTVGSLLRHQVQLAFPSDAAHRREVVSAQRGTNNRSLAYWGIGSDHSKQQIKTRLVYKDQRPLFLYRLFLIWGQRSCFHRSMASSFRWVARCIGFWRLQLPAFKMW